MAAPVPPQRVISARLVEDLPHPVVLVLEDFLGTLVHAADQQLDAVILFGSAAEGRLRPTSDLNLLVITSGLTLAQLDDLRLSLRAGRSAVGLAVMFLDRSEVASAAEAFAVKFMDIKARHRVLYGQSPLESLEVTREAAVRRIRQVLLNLTLRLRELYAMDGDHEERLARILADMTGPIRASAATLLALGGGQTLAPKAALEYMFADGSWHECLRGLSTVHRDEQLPPGGTRRLLGDVLRLLAVLDAKTHELPHLR
jgi:hypothetical protein